MDPKFGVEKSAWLVACLQDQFDLGFIIQGLNLVTSKVSSGFPEFLLHFPGISHNSMRISPRVYFRPIFRQRQTRLCPEF